MSPDKVARKVGDALSTLESVKQEVLERLFGLRGSPSMSHLEVANYLTHALDPEIKLQIASRTHAEIDEATVGEEDVVLLEEQALRELAHAQRKGPRYLS